MTQAPGKSHREGLTLVQMMDMFPTEEAAAKWFEECVWPDGKRVCGKCKSERTRKASHAKMPYWCTDCRSYFSVRTGTPMANSKIPLRKWAIAIYLCLTSLKSVSSMKASPRSRNQPESRMVHDAPQFGKHGRAIAKRHLTDR